ncbi:MAG: hydrogen peroxide-inducible genes activator [Bacteroidetes bacterium]|nr:MAG: hydrogen peroxide-inducible genes activator [Bacteroidota bacterium]
MTLVQYEYIVAVDDYRHFATAAEKCFITQPTLSMQIQKLEDQLGVLIFDRSKHPVVPTDAGEKVIAQARIVLNEARKIKELIDEEKGITSGTLKVGILPTLSPYLLPLFIKNFIEKYPDVEVIVEEGITESIIEKLQKDQLDVGLFVTPSGVNNLEERPIFNEEFVAYVNPAHELSKVESIDSFLLNVDDVWVLNEGHCFRNQVLNICQPPESSNSNFRFQSGSLEALKRLVDMHGGITLMPELATLDMTEDEQKQLRWFKEPKPVREVSLVIHRSFLKRKMTEALFNEILASIPEGIQSKKNTKRVRWN